MDFFKALFDNFKEKLNSAWETQQESPWFVALREKYEELPPLAQKGVNWGMIAFVLLLVFWWPFSNLMDSSDLNRQFEERRWALKELLRIEHDMASSPLIPPSPAPSNLKAQFDQKILAAGVKQEQIKESGETFQGPFPTVEQRGMHYRIDRITLRQALDVTYEVEHTDPSLKLYNLEMTANSTDPHFYEVAFNVVNFSPRISEGGGPAGGTGSAIVEAIKKKGDSGSQPPSIPSGQKPSIPNFRTTQ